MSDANTHSVALDSKPLPLKERMKIAAHHHA